MERVFRPPGINIFQHEHANKLTWKGPSYVCTIKSKGRRGAGVRRRLMVMDPMRRSTVLAAWLKGACVAL
jgi:hypothetical protein